MLPLYLETYYFLAYAPHLSNITSSLYYHYSQHSILHKAARVIPNKSLITWLQMLLISLREKVEVRITAYKALCDYQDPWLHLFIPLKITQL